MRCRERYRVLSLIMVRIKLLFWARGPKVIMLIMFARTLNDHLDYWDVGWGRDRGAEGDRDVAAGDAWAVSGFSRYYSSPCARSQGEPQMNLARSSPATKAGDSVCGRDLRESSRNSRNVSATLVITKWPPAQRKYGS